MPEHETGTWKLPFPDPDGKVKSGAKNFEELAEAVDASLTVVKDEKVDVADLDGGTSLVMPGNINSAFAAITPIEGEHEVSPSDLMLVTLSIGIEKETLAEVKADGVKVTQVGSVGSTSQASYSVSFLLQAGTKYQVKKIGGSGAIPEHNRSAYALAVNH